MTNTVEIRVPAVPVEPVHTDLVRVNLRHLHTQAIPAVQCIFDPVIPRRQVTLLSGHGGVGKSMLGLTLAVHAACGRQWGPFPAVQCRTVYISMEDESDIVRFRVREIIKAYDLDPDAVLCGLDVFDGTRGDPTLAAEVSENGVRVLVATVTMQHLAEAVRGAQLVIVDNASEAFGGNENERRQVRAFVRMLACIARANDAAVMLLAHVDKVSARYGGAGNAYSGSTAWHNSTRSRLALQKSMGVITLVHEKANYTQEADAVTLVSTRSGVLIPQDTPSIVAAAEARAHKDSDAVLAAVCAAIAAGETVSTASGGGGTAWHTLRNYPELGSDFNGRSGRQRVHAALSSMVREGRLVRAKYRKRDRHPGERYELPHAAMNTASETAGGSSPLPPATSPAAAGRAGDRASAGEGDSRRTPALPQDANDPSEIKSARSGCTPGGARRASISTERSSMSTVAAAPYRLRQISKKTAAVCNQPGLTEEINE